MKACHVSNTSRIDIVKVLKRWTSWRWLQLHQGRCSFGAAQDESKSTLSTMEKLRNFSFEMFYWKLIEISSRRWKIIWIQTLNLDLQSDHHSKCNASFQAITTQILINWLIDGHCFISIDSATFKSTGRVTDKKIIWLCDNAVCSQLTCLAYSLSHCVKLARKSSIKKICCDEFLLTTVRGSDIKKLKGDGKYWSEHERRKKQHRRE